MIRQKKTQDNS